MIKSGFSHLKLTAVVAVLAITLIGSARPSTAKTQPPPLAPRQVAAASPTLQIDLSIKEAKRDRLLLNVNWYIEQENLAIQPSKASIIAILIGLHGREYKASSNVTVNPDARSGTVQIVINHLEQIVVPRDVRFVITVALKRDGHAGSLPSRTKEFLLRVEPKE